MWHKINVSYLKLHPIGMAVWKPWNVSIGTALCCEDKTFSQNSNCVTKCLCLFQMRWICQQTSPATCPLRVLCQSRRKATVTLRLAAISSSCLLSPMDTSTRAQMVGNLPFRFGEFHRVWLCNTNLLSQRCGWCYFYYQDNNIIMSWSWLLKLWFSGMTWICRILSLHSNGVCTAHVR